MLHKLKPGVNAAAGSIIYDCFLPEALKIHSVLSCRLFELVSSFLAIRFFTCDEGVQ